MPYPRASDVIFLPACVVENEELHIRRVRDIPTVERDNFLFKPELHADEDYYRKQFDRNDPLPIRPSDRYGRFSVLS